MTDRQTLFAQLLDYLQSPPPPHEYWGTAPDRAAPFNPEQMVGEWIALRHEVKQQNKLCQTTQTALQQALEAERLQNTQLQQRLADLASPPAPAPLLAPKSLLQDLLKIMDALDQASEYGRSQRVELSKTASPAKSWWQKLFSRQPPDIAVFQEVLSSHHQGLEVIRRTLLDLLRQRQVVPLEAVGKPFDPSFMYAIGRQETNSMAENTVIQEVVRGYLWQNQILREAQVMVAVRPGEP
jgi:molecular chaperone GrpE